MQYPADRNLAEVSVRGAVFAARNPLNSSSIDQAYLLFNLNPYQRLQNRLNLQVFVVTFDDKNFKKFPRVVLRSPFGETNPGTLSVLISEPRDVPYRLLGDFKGILDQRNLLVVENSVRRTLEVNNKANYDRKDAQGNIIDININQKTSRFVILGNCHIGNYHAGIVATEIVRKKDHKMNTAKFVALRARHLKEAAQVSSVDFQEVRRLQKLALANYGL